VMIVARAVKDGVRDVFGITLKPEPVLVGCVL
jgi:UDP-N-acetylmuramate dehydrogenase